MKAIVEAIMRLLRGPRCCRELKRMGIDPKRYWLLMDLFGQLSDRREIMNQLGRDSSTLQLVSWMYFALMSLCGLVLVFAGTAVATYFWLLMAMTAVFLLLILIPETANSLVNPIEGLILAHQPIDGATYTAAKLSHLLRILLYLVPGLSVGPALAGMLLKSAPWFYPLLHVAAAFAAGIVMALLCCSLFGWLIRFVPARRLKAAGQVAEILPWAGYLLMQVNRKWIGRFRVGALLPASPELRYALMGALGLAAVAAVFLGLRSLSGDYLVRVSSIAHGSSNVRAKSRRSRLSGMVARLFGGPPARAAFEYIPRMMRRDWQFRRQMIPMVVPMAMPLVFLAGALRTSPFSGKFTAAHALPHAFGFVFYAICTVIAYGSDYKGAWVFLLAPSRALGGFARGVHAALWVRLVVIPHLALLAPLAWFWGIRDAALFVAFSAAVASLYLGIELRTIDATPFTKQPVVATNPYAVVVLLAGGMIIAAAVALQYFLLFRSPLAVAMATVGVGAAAYAATRSSLGTLETTMRFTLGLESGESGSLYKEID